MAKERNTLDASAEQLRNAVERMEQARAQISSGGYLWDYVATGKRGASSFQERLWIKDYYVPTNYDWLPGVPHCSGFTNAW